MDMNSVRLAPAAIMLALLSGCSTGPQRAAPPTSMLFAGYRVDQVQQMFVLACSQDARGVIAKQTANMIECTRPMGDSFKEIMYKTLIEPSQGATNPDMHFQWTFAQTSGGVLVSSAEWVSFQTAFGQTNRNPVAGIEAADVMASVRAQADANLSLPPSG